jgi:hypothetical protein
MAIQAKQKSKRGRTSQARRATSNKLEQTAVTPAILPESAAPDTSIAESNGADSALLSDSGHQALDVRMCKIGDETHVTLVVDGKSLVRDFGTDDPDFFNGLVDQVANASSKGCLYLDELGLDSRDERQYPDELGIKFMLAFMRRRKPRDEIHAMILAQMAATHVAIMKFANRLAHARSLQERDSAERTYNKLARTFAVQVEALQRYRSKSKNKVVIQHVQAIVGNVSPPTHRMAASKKRARVTPQLIDARQPPMEINGDPQRARVPLRRK